MSSLRAGMFVLCGVLLSGLLLPGPARAEAWEEMVDLTDQTESVKPYYNIYERNHTYIEDFRTQRENMDARRKLYVAPLIANRAAGMGGRATADEGMGERLADASGDPSVSADSSPAVATLSEAEVRAFVIDLKEKTTAATQKGDLEALNNLTRQSASPSFTLDLTIESYLEGKFSGTATNTMTLDQVIASNKGLSQMSDVSMTYDILSIAIKTDEAVVNDHSKTTAKMDLSGIGSASSENTMTCTDTIRRQPDGKLAYAKSVCKVRSVLNRDRPI